jgi:hypothetical protein
MSGFDEGKGGGGCEAGGELGRLEDVAGAGGAVHFGIGDAAE